MTDFYNLASKDGVKEPKPVVTDSDALKEADRLSENYPNDGKIYIVRGNQLFSVSSKNISVKLKPNGLRDISIVDGEMLKVSKAP